MNAVHPVHFYTLGAATRLDQYTPVPLESRGMANYTGVIEPDDLRVQLPKRIQALETCSTSPKAIYNALVFCTVLPIVKVPDSVYADEGDVMLYWETSQGSVLVAIDEKYMHFYVRKEGAEDIVQSEVAIDDKVGFIIRPHLPSHPRSKKHDVSERTD